MDNDLNKRLCEKLKIHWCEVDPVLLRCKCGTKGPSANPNFLDDAGAVELLRIMMGREDWGKFSLWINAKYGIEGVTNIILPILSITTPGALAKAVDEFLPEKEEGK